MYTLRYNNLDETLLMAKGTTIFYKITDFRVCYMESRNSCSTLLKIPQKTSKIMSVLHDIG